MKAKEQAAGVAVVTAFCISHILILKGKCVIIGLSWGQGPYFFPEIH